ncbi:prepilin-type N-terminal cleavage/methylation domain-containing protein [Scytonema sp. UIC 10036]|uniref:prepilin-type N-terminal cleavage/methylation domain-containing protein n=1 Tax=Scytonema sp. UIC 10036 TaxID=2304196 RepID=UPI0012DA7300|nr:prepilin-type N-terminal cleavage/methylation domain-containing protein [Scytonema sp. UIC 10036]MUH00218.1 prepilin-type N-terminal cleavage/methylation domain-containing protein [Scytonema sp. UIC 10036]
MYKVALLLVLEKITKEQQYLRYKCCHINKHRYSDAGFSLVEVLVAVLMIGILAAIAAPGWLAFVNRQRVNKANDAILTAIQQAQREAKKNKRTYSVSFRNDNGIPKVAIYYNTSPPATTNPIWKPLGEDMAFKSGQVLLYSNLDSSTYNKLVSTGNVNYTPSSGTSSLGTITFDYMGALLDASALSQQLGLKIAVATPNSGSYSATNTLKRCVIVETLLGGMRTGKNSNNCN